MTEFIIVRHGNTFDAGDVILRVGARTDLPLSESGRSQADALSAHFRTRYAQGFDLVLCSPLLRTKETATAILSAYPQPPELTIDPFLTEIDYGPDEGQPEDKVVARLGTAAIEAWDASAITPPDWLVDPEQLRRDWKTLFARHKHPETYRRILIVTSNGVARFALDAVTAGRENATSLKLKTGAYGVIQSHREQVELITWNQRP